MCLICLFKKNVFDLLNISRSLFDFKSCHGLDKERNKELDKYMNFCHSLNYVTTFLS